MLLRALRLAKGPALPLQAASPPALQGREPEPEVQAVKRSPGPTAPDAGRGGVRVGPAGRAPRHGQPDLDASESLRDKTVGH